MGTKRSGHSYSVAILNFYGVGTQQMYHLSKEHFAKVASVAFPEAYYYLQMLSVTTVEKTKWCILGASAGNQRCIDHLITLPPACYACYSSCYSSNGGKLMKCSACKGVTYCGTQCQKADWNNHKMFCQKK